MARADDLLRLWNDFVSLTEQQSEFIRTEDVDGLLAALEKRDMVIQKIKNMQDETGAEPLAEVAVLREKALKINDENEAKVKTWLSLIDSDIKKLNASRKVVLGYGRQVTISDSEFFDKKV